MYMYIVQTVQENESHMERVLNIKPFKIKNLLVYIKATFTFF